MINLFVYLLIILVITILNVNGGDCNIGVEDDALGVGI